MLPPLCVGLMLSWRVFSLINGLPSPFSVTCIRLCSNGSSVLCRCPTPPRPAGEPYGLGLRPPSCCPSCPAGIPEVSRFSCMKFPGVLWVLRLRGTAQGLALAPLLMLPSTIPTVSASRFARFRSSIAQPACTPVYASPSASQQPTQNSGPSGSLLLSRKTLSFSTSCRFIPALRDPEDASS